jgi:hypothetical protein
MSDEKDELRLLKAFATELVRKKTMAAQKKSEPALKTFVVQLAMFAALVV